MSRRKNRKSRPNLPEAALERARKQAAGEDPDLIEDEPEEEQAVEAEADEPQEEAVPEEQAAPVPASTRTREERRSRRSRRRQPGGVQFSQRRRLDPDRDKDRIDVETIQQMLANPTKFVSEEDLRKEYAFVLSDLKNMGLLAAALMIVMVFLAQFI
jgi:hypothetical protein